MLSIPFVGRLRSKVLEKAGYTLEKIKKANPEDLANLDGFSLDLAKRIIRYAQMVNTQTSVPNELIFKEFRCSECGAIVSEVEATCHRCGHVFYKVPYEYDDLVEDLGEVIAEILNAPQNSSLWREGASILVDMDKDSKAYDFKFKASSLELEDLSETDLKKNEEIPVIPKRKPSKKQPKRYDGLVNGNGVNIGELGQMRRNTRMKSVIVIMIIILPIIFAGILTMGSRPGIIIDGHFGDWANVPEMHGYGSFFKSVKIKEDLSGTYLYIQGTYGFLAGSDYKLAILVDDDSNSSTGFPVNSLGVDKIIWVYSKEGVIGYRTERFLDGNWTAWGSVDFAIGSHQIELKTYRISESARMEIYYVSGGVEHYSSVYTLTPHLWGLLEGGKILSENDVAGKVTLWNSGSGDYLLKTLYLRNMGNSSARIKVVGAGFSIYTNLTNTWTAVSFPTAIKVSSCKQITFIYEGGAKKYETLKPILRANNTFSVIDRADGSYIGSIPLNKNIDGVFLDWADAHASPRDRIPANVDLKEYGETHTGNIKLYMSVYGNLFGVGVPKLSISGGNNSHGNGTHIAGLPKDTLEIYVDTDKNVHTGYPIEGLGADYLIRIEGNLQHVQKVLAYVWMGKWVNSSVPVKYAKDADSMEMSMGLRGKVYYRLVNFDGIWDKHASGKFRADKVKLVKPVLIGKFNSTELAERFGNDVNVTAGWDYNQTSPTIVSNGTALFVAFDAGYADNSGHIVSVGFAVSTDDGQTWDAYYFTAIWGFSPVVTVNGYGDVYIFFENQSSGAYFEFLVHYHTNGTYSDGTPIWHLMSITSDTWWGSVDYISAAGSGGVVYVAFEYAATSEDIYTIYSTDSNDWSASWGVSLVTDSSYDEVSPCVSMIPGTTPEVFVAYSVKMSSSYGTYYEVWFNYTNAGQSVWSTGQRLTASDGTDGLDDDDWPSVGANANYAFIVWEHVYKTSLGTSNIDLWIANISSTGIVNSETKLTSGTAGWEQSPNIFVAENTIYVAYYNATTTGEVISLIYSTNGGLSWSTPIQVSDHAKVNNTIPVVSVYQDGTYVYIVWSDDYPGSSGDEYADIFFDKEAVPEFNSWSFISLLLIVGMIVYVRRRKKD